jgi:thioredoxin reductase
MALVMYREGTTPRMLTVPELDDHFQTAIPGQYLIGEVAGKPLVKNAANLGRAVIEHIAKELGAQPPAAAGVLDVVVVGSGPAGLSAGLTCVKKQLSCTVLEKEHIISSTVSRYPKGKHFMAEPCNSQNVSFLPVFDGTKEELVAAWERVVAGAKLPIKLGEAVDTVKRGDDGIFTIKTTVATYRARTVVLATGLRGKPRLLAVPGANLPKVEALLDDPAEWAGQHVLVVGGGDSAVEGAMSLADVGATVTLSYRGDGFKRCKQGNQKRLAEMVSGQKLSLLLESNVKEFTDDAVAIKLKDGSVSTIPNQRAFVLIGADTPVTWLEANNVRFIERPHLYALGSTEDVVRRVVPDALECTKVPDEALAVILGKQVHKSAGRRMMSAVEHLRDEFQEVVTQVSTAFRLSDLEQRAQRRMTAHTPVPSRPSRPGAPPLIPLSRLTGRSTGSQTAFGPERTVITASPFGEFSEERTSISGQPLRPRSSKRTEATGHAKVGAGGSDTTTTGSQLALTRDREVAFEQVFDHTDTPVSRVPARTGAPRTPPPPPRTAPPQRRARTDAPASTGFDDDDAATALDSQRIE